MSVTDERKYVRYRGGPEGMPMLRPDAPALFGGRGIGDDLAAAERRWCEALGAPVPPPPRVEPNRGATPLPGKRRAAPDGRALDVVLGAVAAHFRVSPAALLGPGRNHPLCRARHAACVLLGELGWSSTQIGAAIGRARFAVTRGQCVARLLCESQPQYRGKLARARDDAARAIAAAAGAEARI